MHLNLTVVLFNELFEKDLFLHLITKKLTFRTFFVSSQSKADVTAAIRSIFDPVMLSLSLQGFAMAASIVDGIGYPPLLICQLTGCQHRTGRVR